ncbi:MAG: hypothetical protein KF799_09345 [Bdellovibrionales bacterium]|nr:hypothetical protein [Bdellovibrionales bacterium]
MFALAFIFKGRLAPIGIFVGLLLFTPDQALALRAPDMSGDDSGAVAVYTFDEIGGSTANDTSGVGQALNLVMSTEGNLPTGDGTPIRTNASLQSGYLLINPKPNGAASGMPDEGYQSAQRHRTFLISTGPATKLATCTSGFTLQAFVRPWFPFQGSQAGNMIVGLSNSQTQNSVMNPNFAVLQSGESGAEAVTLRVRTSGTQATNQSSVPGAFSSVRETENSGRLTEIIATREPNGTLTVYVNRIARSSLVSVAPAFTAEARLVIGNELVPLTLKPDGDTNVDEQRNWSGEIHHLAIYCRGFTRAEILGATLTNKATAAIVRPLTGVQVTSVRHEARKLVERLAGVAVPLDHPMVLRVEERLQNGDRLGASKIVTGDFASGEKGHPDFLNTTVKQMAMKMSNRDETIRAPFNDFAAAFIGVTRDERNAQELLNADFFYMANPSKATVRTDVFRDLLTSNNHYQDLEDGRWDIGAVLMRVPSAEVPSGYPPGQLIATTPAGASVPHPDPAGVLTSRAFMAAHAIAGTNRRLVEYTFREFMCMPMADMADTAASPARIGRDVDRVPGGDGTKFETSCKGCHTVMDGFRGAFAKFDFANLNVNNSAYGFVRNTQVNLNGDFGFGNNEKDQYGTVRKMNHNETTFPNGFTITDDSFVNNAVGATNRDRFGWGGSNKIGGTGVRQFGQMIADSRRFSECMAKRVYESVCTPGKTTGPVITPEVASWGERFKASGYKLRTLFQIVAADAACATGMGR